MSCFALGETIHIGPDQENKKGVALAEVTLSPRRFARLRRLKVASGRKGPLSLIRWQVY